MPSLVTMRMKAFQPFYVEGKFQHAGENYVEPRTFQGKPGYHVITPFQLATGYVLTGDRADYQ